MMTIETSMKMLDAYVLSMRKTYKSESAVFRAGDKVLSAYDVIPAPSAAIAVASGIGGFPYGRIIEIFGPESSGKTTLALEIVAQAQKCLRRKLFPVEGKKEMLAFLTPARVHYFDAEHALDPKYAGNVGVNMAELLISQPTTAEECLNMVKTSIESGMIDVIVVDSVAALTPKAELDGEIGDSLPGLQSRLMSQTMRMIVGLAAVKRVCVIFINQIREKIGVMYGSNETTPGGRALRFYSSMRVDVRRIKSIEKNGVFVHNETRAKFVKNKCAPPYGEAFFNIEFGRGIMSQLSTFKIALAYGVIQRTGAWCKFEGENIGMGEKATVIAIAEDAMLEAKILGKIGEVCGLAQSYIGRYNSVLAGTGEFSMVKKEGAIKAAVEMKEEGEEEGIAIPAGDLPALEE